MSENKLTQAIKRAASKPHRGVKPGDKPVHRGGGNTAPASVISNPARIAGVKRAFVRAAQDLVDRPKLVDHVRAALGESVTTFTLTAKEKTELRKMLAFAKAAVPDWVKLPAEHRPGLDAEPAPKTKNWHFVMPVSTPTPTDPAPSQPARPASTPRVLPQRRDSSVLMRMAAAR